MYAHNISTLFLSEASGMVDPERQRRIADDHEKVVEFWELFDHMNGKPDKKGAPIELNHSKPAGFIAINLPEFSEHLAAAGLRLPCDAIEMKKLLQTSRRRKFKQKNQVVNSAIRAGCTVRCWVFQTEAGTASS